MSPADATAPRRPRRSLRWLLAAAALVLAVVIVLVVRPLVVPEAGRAALERAATRVLTGLDLSVRSGENNLGKWSVGAQGGMTVEATVEGNQRAKDQVSAELRRHGWFVVPPSEQLSDAEMYVKAVKLVGGRLATVEMMAAVHPVLAEEREPTFQASLAFRFIGEG